jgi:Divergent InlB B-repeat domain
MPAQIGLSVEGTCPIALLLFDTALATLAPFPHTIRDRWIPGVAMSQKCSAVVSVFGVFCVAVGLLNLASCGRDQQLTSISIQPTTETFGAANIPVNEDAGLSVQLRALGTYIHPPVTKDITNQVTWASNTPNLVTVNPTGLAAATGNECGGSLVSASVTTNGAGGVASSGAIITGYTTVNVVCFTGTGQALTLVFAGTGTGTVTSVPPGLSCASTCSTALPTGSTIVLTATPTNGSTFGGWSGCDSVSGQVCTVSNISTSRTVQVTFL